MLHSDVCAATHIRNQTLIMRSEIERRLSPFNLDAVKLADRPIREPDGLGSEYGEIDFYTDPTNVRLVKNHHTLKSDMSVSEIRAESEKHFNDMWDNLTLDG